MIINAFIKGQALTLSQPLIVAGSNDYLELRAVFQTGDWSGLNVWAHFTQDGKNIFDAHLIDGYAGKDQHINLSAGVWHIYFTGHAAEGEMRITTNQQPLEVQTTGFVCGPFPDVPLTHAEKITQEATQARRLVEEARQQVTDNAPLAERAEEAAKASHASATQATIAMEGAKEAEERAAAHVTEAAQEVKRASNEADRAKQEADQALSNKLNGIDQHNTDPASHPHLLAEVSRVESIAKGRNFAVVFPTKDAMETFLLDPENTKGLEKGTNLYIEDLNTPDYWWDGKQAQELEVEHPDLSQYVTKTQLSMELPAVVTQEEYDRLQAEGLLVPGRIYYVTVGGV